VPIARNYINGQVGRLRHMFKWGVSERLALGEFLPQFPARLGQSLLKRYTIFIGLVHASTPARFDDTSGIPPEVTAPNGRQPLLSFRGRIEGVLKDLHQSGRDRHHPLPLPVKSLGLGAANGESGSLPGRILPAALGKPPNIRLIWLPPKEQSPAATG
jgi:hypothetical protein